jgi:hypothetical protein
MSIALSQILDLVGKLDDPPGDDQDRRDRRVGFFQQELPARLPELSEADVSWES